MKRFWFVVKSIFRRPSWQLAGRRLGYFFMAILWLPVLEISAHLWIDSHPVVENPVWFMIFLMVMIISGYRCGYWLWKE